MQENKEELLKYQINLVKKVNEERYPNTIILKT